ncbi:hypothetical protein V9T40_000775 [Parthenolecanium corni]|uniref:Uncharacterized protein n=1 Tax=Parthenolecanium corni TaxID=536013 RepID=A0AAN9TBM3_9HEMI
MDGANRSGVEKGTQRFRSPYSVVEGRLLIAKDPTNKKRLPIITTAASRPGPTHAACRLYAQNRRYYSAPFIMTQNVTDFLPDVSIFSWMSQFSAGCLIFRLVVSIFV